MHILQPQEDPDGEFQREPKTQWEGARTDGTQRWIGAFLSCKLNSSALGGYHCSEPE